MSKTKLWMLVAILTSATMFSSCVDNMDNPAPTVDDYAGETAKQVQFWSKFDKWQTDSCTRWATTSTCTCCTISGGIPQTSTLVECFPMRQIFRVTAYQKCCPQPPMLM